MNFLNVNKMIFKAINAIILLILSQIEWTMCSTVSQKQFYCNLVKKEPNACSQGNVKLPHIGCSTKLHEWSNKCYNPTFLPVDRDFINLVLYLHNFYRNQVALGQVPGFPKAARMATLRWDNELSYLACLNVQQCQMHHDKCRATRSFLNAGQNLAITTFYVTNPSEYILDYPPSDAMFYQKLQAWFDEWKLIGDMGPIKRCCGSSHLFHEIGHFTQMIQERATHVGCCAAQFFHVPPGYYRLCNATLFACNYAWTNMMGTQVYEFGRYAGENCKTGRNPQYPGLCSVNEPISAELEKPKFIVQAPRGMSTWEIIMRFKIPAGYQLEIKYF